MILVKVKRNLFICAMVVATQDKENLVIYEELYFSSIRFKVNKDAMFNILDSVQSGYWRKSLHSVWGSGFYSSHSRVCDPTNCL